MASRGRAAVFVRKIEGDYFNIVGLPLYTLYKMLMALPLNYIKPSC